MLPESQKGHIIDQQGHIAEIFLSGLLDQLPLNENVVDPDQVQYDFADGVRDLLLSSLPRNKSVQVLMKFTDFIESHSDQFSDLTVLLADPMSATKVSLTEKSRPFANVTAQVLRRLGSGYTPLAEQIESVSTDVSAKVELPESSIEALPLVEPEIAEPASPPPFQDVALASRLEEKEYRQTIATHSVGAFASAPTRSGVNVTFGIYLPGIEPQAGYEVMVSVNHKNDSFVPNINTMDFPLTQVANSQNNLWQANVTIPVTPGTHFGQPGTYLYHYQLLQRIPGTLAPQVLVRRFTDPFARAMDDEDVLSAFVTPGLIPDFTWTDHDWKTPELEDLMVYELQVEEFNRNFNGVIERLPYLKSLGITCLELMPVTSWKLDFDWGYGPLHYFAPNERWGGVQGLKRLVNACHQADVAVILDVVYHHVNPSFPYHLVYRTTGIESPMIKGIDPFGPAIDFGKAFAHEYVQAANLHWLEEYHVDGFRYDNVTGFYDGPTGIGYARIAYETYTTSLTLPRFTPSGGLAPGEYSRIIQCPEALNQPQEILRYTYSNCTWQSGLLNKAESMATSKYVDDDFVHLLDTRFLGYPERKTVHDITNQPIDMPVTPFQYLENHGHSRLITFFKPPPSGVPSGDRSTWYKLQPFAIALYTCQGIPMLWQGQEFAESYILPLQGSARINIRRDVHWEYSRDDFGGPLLRLYRILGTLRHAYPALRSHESYYYSVQSRTSDGIVAYSRQSTAAQQFAIVFLNFSDQRQSISIPFPEPGTYREMIDEAVRTSPFEITVSTAINLSMSTCRLTMATSSSEFQRFRQFSSEKF